MYRTKFLVRGLQLIFPFTHQQKSSLIFGIWNHRYILWLSSCFLVNANLFCLLLFSDSDQVLCFFIFSNFLLQWIDQLKLHRASSAIWEIQKSRFVVVVVDGGGKSVEIIYSTHHFGSQCSTPAILFMWSTVLVTWHWHSVIGLFILAWFRFWDIGFPLQPVWWRGAWNQWGNLRDCLHSL